MQCNALPDKLDDLAVGIPQRGKVKVQSVFKKKSANNAESARRHGAGMLSAAVQNAMAIEALFNIGFTDRRTTVPYFQLN